MRQRLAVYINGSTQMFYVGMYNEATYIKSASLATCINRAKHLIKSGKPAMSGFSLALINTGFTGWTHTTLDSFDNVKEAGEVKTKLIRQYASLGYTFVGSNKPQITKSDRSEVSEIPHKWNNKWNLNNFSLKKAMGFVDFISKTFPGGVSHNIRKDALMEVIREGSTLESHRDLYLYIKERVA